MPFENVSFQSDGLTLRGWLLRSAQPRRGLIVYLHGVADNRASGLGVARRYVPRGYDVLLYDSRAHGQSDGNDCTYGFYAKRDLAKVLDALAGPKRLFWVPRAGHNDVLSGREVWTVIDSWLAELDGGAGRP